MEFHSPKEPYAGDEHTIALAKAWVVHEHGVSIERPWAESSVTPDSYDDPTYRVRIFVWLGSPPKGYVVATPIAILAIAGGLHKTKTFAPQHRCDVDYRSEHAWTRK